MRRINDALGGFYSTLVYVRILSVTLGKDRHIHTVTLGKGHHIHIRIYACATLYWQCQWAEGLKRLLWRDGQGWQERVSVRLVEGEGCSLYKQPLMIKILNGSLLM